MSRLYAQTLQAPQYNFMGWLDISGQQQGKALRNFRDKIREEKRREDTFIVAIHKIQWD